MAARRRWLCGVKQEKLTGGKGQKKNYYRYLQKGGWRKEWVSRNHQTEKREKEGIHANLNAETNKDEGKNGQQQRHRGRAPGKPWQESEQKALLKPRHSELRIRTAQAYSQLTNKKKRE